MSKREHFPVAYCCCAVSRATQLDVIADRYGVSAIHSDEIFWMNGNRQCKID